MAEGITIEQIADEMYDIIKEQEGKKKLKATDLTKEMIAKHYDKVTKDDCKKAIKQLIDSGRCVYGYFGGSSIEIPHTEGAEK